MKTICHRHIKRISLSTVLTGILVFFITATTVQAQNNMCIPSIGGLAPLPNIDGIVEGYTGGGPVQDDPGWNGATRFNLSADLGVTRSAVFQVGRSGSSVYISFVVDTPTPGDDNTIVLVLSTDGNTANDWRIHIQPFDVGMVNGSNQTPLSVTYWRNSSTWNTGGSGTTASPGFWLKDNIRFSKAGSRWAIEIEIPREMNPANAHLNNKIYFPSSGTFNLYADVLSTSIATGTYTEDPWPPGHIIVPDPSDIFPYVTEYTPDSSQWGTASFNDRSECTGVSLTYTNVGVLDPTNSNVIKGDIRRYNPSGGFTETQAQCEALADDYLWSATKGPLNTFVAKPFNNMTTTAKVFAKFFIANWGIPSATQWRPIGEYAGGVSPPTVTNNPTSEVTITDGNHGNINSTTWELSYKQSCVYSKAKRSDLSDTYIGHQCIQVELDSTDPGTRFLNKSVQRNMNFVTASKFSRDAEISAKGYGDPPAGRENHEFVITVDNKVDQYKIEKDFYIPPMKGQKGRVSREYSRIPVIKFPDQISEAMTWVARGYLKTGNKLIINEHEYEYAKAVGGFGYVAGHSGEVKSWQQVLKGSGLNEISEGVYLIGIPPGEVAKVNTTIEAKEKTPCGCFKFWCQ